MERRSDNEGPKGIVRYDRRPATLSGDSLRDLGLIMKNLRDADMEEAYLISGGTPWTALMDSVSNSDEAWIEYADGVPVAAYGVGADDSGNGYPWMVGTKGLERHRKQVMRESRKKIAEWRPWYASFGNFVFARNTTAIRWLKRLGFTINPAIPVGPFVAPFHPFNMD